MILSRKHLMDLVGKGKAEKVGIARGNDGKEYVIVDRYDVWRTDHFPATAQDISDYTGHDRATL